MFFGSFWGHITLVDDPRLVSFAGSFGCFNLCLWTPQCWWCAYVHRAPACALNEMKWVFDECLDSWLVEFLNGYGIGIGRQFLKPWTTQAPSNSLPYTDHRQIGVCTLFQERCNMRSEKSSGQIQPRAVDAEHAVCVDVCLQGHSPVCWQVVPYQRWWHHKATIHAPAATALAAGTTAWAQNDKPKLCCVRSASWKMYGQRDRKG